MRIVKGEFENGHKFNATVPDEIWEQFQLNYKNSTSDGAALLLDSITIEIVEDPGDAVL